VCLDWVILKLRIELGESYVVAALFWAGVGALLSWAFFRSLWERRQAEIAAASKADGISEKCLPEPAWETDLKLAKQAETQAWDEVWERQSAREAATATVRDKLRRAKDVIEELQLQWCLRDLWQELRKGDLSLYSPEAAGRFKNLARQDFTLSHSKVAWEWEEMPFELDGDETGYEYRTLSLSLASEVVLAVTYSMDTASDWWTVKALKVGPWMAEAIKMQALLSIESDASMDGIMDEDDAEIAARISLGDAT
jgi:hypothetical protein